VQHGSDAEARPEMLRIDGDRQHRLRCRLEQKIVDQRLVVEGNAGDLSWQCEDDVEVSDWQEIGLPLGKPGASSSTLAFRTVPVSAGIVGDPPLSAILTGLDMSAQGSGAAVLDRGHDLELG
jgi:hypothetical protein